MNAKSEIDVKEQSTPSFEIFSAQGVEEMGINMKDMLPGLFAGKSKRKKIRVGDAREILIAEEAEKLVDQQSVSARRSNASSRAGIVFLDEIDQIAGRQTDAHGPDVLARGGPARPFCRSSKERPSTRSTGWGRRITSSS